MQKISHNGKNTASFGANIPKTGQNAKLGGLCITGAIHPQIADQKLTVGQSQQ